MVPQAMMWRNKPKEVEPGFKVPVHKPPEVLWSSPFYDPDTEIEFRIGLQWRGTGAMRDGIMLIYQTHNADRWVSYNIGVVPRCALQWIARNMEDVNELRGPKANIEELLREPRIAEILAQAKFLPKGESDVSDKTAKLKEVAGNRRRATIRRHKK